MLKFVIKTRLLREVTQVFEDLRVLFSKCDALRDLVPFVQFKKREEHPWRSVNFSKVAGLAWPPPWVFSRFLNCANGTKSCNGSLLWRKRTEWCWQIIWGWITVTMFTACKVPRLGFSFNQVASLQNLLRVKLWIRIPGVRWKNWVAWIGN